MGTSHAARPFIQARRDAPPGSGASAAASAGAEETGRFAPEPDPPEHRPQPREIAGMPITVLTSDTQLCGAIQAAVMDDHPLFMTNRLEDAAKSAAAGRCPVLITDQALDSSGFARTTAALREHEPALVIVAVGNRDENDALKALVSSRVVDRFMLKPVTPALTRIVIESVAREYRWRTAHTHADPDPTQFARTAVQGTTGQAAVSTPLAASADVEEAPQVALQPLQLADATHARRGDVVRTPGAIARPSWIVVIAMLAAVAAAMWAIMLQRLPDIDPREVIAKNLDAAQQAFDAGHYLDPAERSAYHYYNTVLALEPANAGARNGIGRIADHFIEDAGNLIVSGRFAEAVVALESVRRVQPTHQRLPILEAQLRNTLQSQLAQARESFSPGSQIPDKQVTAAVVTKAALPSSGPRANDPRIAQPAASASGSAAAQSGAAQPGARESQARVILEANEAIALGQFEAARQLIGEAEDRGVPATEISALTSALILALDTTQRTRAKNDSPQLADTVSAQATLRAAPMESVTPPVMAIAPPEVAPQSPRLLKLVEPEYPGEARLRGIEGWVDLSLAVSASGDVIDPRVENSSMRHLFGRAALEAVKQWKYAPQAADPAERATERATERVRVRVEFQLRD